MALLVNASWAKKLSLNGLDLASIAEGSPEHMNILSEFVSKDLSQKSIIKDLEQYVKAFGPLAMTTVMSLYIREAMTSSSLNPALTNGKLMVNQQLFKDVTDQVSKALNKMPQDERFELLMSLATEEISPYNYEAIEFIFSQFEEKNDRAEKILAFLKTYKRVGAPGEDEITQWVDSKPTPFPTQIASLRLSFHSILREINNPKAMFKLLMNSEFVLDNYDQWLNASKLFKLSPEYVRVLAAQNSISKLLSNASCDDKVWHTVPILPMEVFKSAFQCLEGITDLLKSTSTAHWIATRLPNGNDKLLVTRMRLELASRWYEVCQDEDSLIGI